VRDAKLGRAQSDSVKFDEIPLPPLRIDGKLARAHTQGVLIHEDGVFVTARRDDVRPRRALLLWTRLDESRRRTPDTWTHVFDITPTELPAGWTGVLDHAGGFDTDGEHLWIPLSHSRSDGKTLIRKYAIRTLLEDSVAKPVAQLVVDDHIGAVAVSRERKMLYGANWDTRTVHFLAMDGRRTTKSPRETCVYGEPGWANAVQDWKVRGDLLIASGLDKSPLRPSDRPRALIQAIDLGSRKLVWELRLPRHAKAGDLTREGMAIHEGSVWLLPEDLGASNRIFRARLNPLRRPGSD
jgi:hypothetical protein